jgi:hypothetical protein
VRKGENFGQSIWDPKSGAIGSIMRNTLGTWGTPWELDGKTLKTQKKPKNNSFNLKYVLTIFFSTRYKNI